MVHVVLRTVQLGAHLKSLKDNAPRSGFPLQNRKMFSPDWLFPVEATANMVK